MIVKKSVIHTEESRYGEHQIWQKKHWSRIAQPVSPKTQQETNPTYAKGCEMNYISDGATLCFPIQTGR